MLNLRKKCEIPNTEHWIWYPMVFCKIVITMPVLLKIKKSKKIRNKDRLWAENLKTLQLFEQNWRFQNAIIRPCISPPEYKPPPLPARKIWRKGPLTKNNPRGLLSEFYGIR